MAKRSDRQKRKTRAPNPGQWKPGQTPAGAKPWRPGQSGNPSGRPRRKTLTDELVGLLDKPASVNTALARAARTLGLDPGTVTVIEVVVMATILHALKGNAAVLLALWDRIDGKVPTRFAGYDGGPVVVAEGRFLELVLMDPDAMALARELAGMLHSRGADRSETNDA